MSQARAADSLLREMVFTLLMALASGLLTALLLLLLTLGLTQAATAQESDNVAAMHPLLEEPPGSGSLLLATAGTVIDAPRLDTRVTMRISGLLARVTVKQQFTNPATTWAEGVYTFPLPEDAAVDQLRLRIGERLIEGEIQERQAARERYQQARSAGRRASLLSQQRANIFTTSVANIAPGESVEVVIEYQQTLRYDQGELSIRFPMVVAPRYIPGVPLTEQPSLQFQPNGWALDTDQVPDASRITPPVMNPAQPAINPVAIEVLLNAGMPLASLQSAYHQIDSELQADGRYRIRLRQQQVPATRDFVLSWRPQPASTPRAALFRERRNERDFAMLMVLPPLQSGGQQRPPRELVLVIDTSGSMEGASIIQARAAVTLALQRLQPGDRFNLIEFNNRPRALFAAAVAATPANLRRAVERVARLRADGGTEMAPALQLALQGGDSGGVLRQVIFITDGSVGNEQALFRLIRQQLGSSRLFTVGIGSAPNTLFMSGAARLGRGSFTYIGDTAEVQQKMAQLFSKLESPMLTDIEIDWPPGSGVEHYPEALPDLYLGEPLLIAAAADNLPAAVTVRGRVGDQSWQQRLSLSGAAADAGVRVLWARRRIASLMGGLADGAVPSVVRQSVLEVALEHGLVSRYTSLVAIDQTPARPADQPLERKPMPVNLPSGWSAAKVFGTLPQTATPAPLQLLLGLLALLGAAWVRWGRYGAAK